MQCIIYCTKDSLTEFNKEREKIFTFANLLSEAKLNVTEVLKSPKHLFLYFFELVTDSPWFLYLP